MSIRPESAKIKNKINDVIILRIIFFDTRETDTEMFSELLLDLRADTEDIAWVYLGYEDDY